MVSEIAEQVASDKGILPQLVIARKGPERKVDFSGFECFLGMYQYWEVPSAADHAQLRTCLEQTVKDNPAYAEACAALAYIYIDEQRYRRNPREGVDASVKATAAVDRALGLEPTNPLVLGAAMTLAIEKPDRDVATFHRYGQRALELRPNDGFAMANYGMKRAIYLGEWKEGLELNAKASELSLTLPGWYLLLPAFDALLLPNDVSMIEVTERLPVSHSVAGNMLRAIAAHRADSKDLLVHHVNILRQDGVNDIPAALSYIRNRRLEPGLQNALETQFSKAFRAARTS